MAQRLIHLFLLFALVLLRLISKQVLINEPLKREDRDDFSRSSVDIESVDSEIKPRKRSKINSFSNIKPSRKPAMIASWEGDYKLSWTLDESVNINSIFFEESRRHHCSHVVDKIGFIFL